MTSKDILYRVTADNGLGGFVVGREAADELVTTLCGRSDVLSVEAVPVTDPRNAIACCGGVGEGRAFSCANCPHHEWTLAETLEFLGHGEQL